ncbi:MAG: COG1470 family protein, partial [Parafilimonas sp.]
MFAESTIISRRGMRPYSLLLFAFLLAGLCISQSSLAQTTAGTSGPSSFTSNLINIEAAVSETFRYNVNLHNGFPETRIYDLYAQVPEGWLIAFRTMGSQVSSVSVDAGKTQDISIEINASQVAKPARYNIPVMAISSKDTLRLNLQAVVKGAYGINLSTPTGLLS